MRCCLCDDPHDAKSGAKTFCAYGQCMRAFHVTCAAKANLKMELKEVGDKTVPQIFCSAHGGGHAGSGKRRKSAP